MSVEPRCVHFWLNDFFVPVESYFVCAQLKQCCENFVGVLAKTGWRHIGLHRCLRHADRAGNSAYLVAVRMRQFGTQLAVQYLRIFEDLSVVINWATRNAPRMQTSQKFLASENRERAFHLGQ